MANTANTQEPTMEEILASIRRIISEDSDEAKPAEAPKAKAAAKPAVKPAPEPEEADEDVLELTDIVPEEDEVPPPPPPRAAAVENDVVMVERAPLKSAPKPSERPPMLSRPRYNTEVNEGLISEEVRNQASSSFMQLTRTTLVSESPDPRSLEAMVQEMLRPVLEDWLNQNLPGIVERLVQQEIDRVSRRGR